MWLKVAPIIHKGHIVEAVEVNAPDRAPTLKVASESGMLVRVPVNLKLVEVMKVIFGDEEGNVR